MGNWNLLTAQSYHVIATDHHIPSFNMIDRLLIYIYNNTSCAHANTIFNLWSAHMHIFFFVMNISLYKYMHVSSVIITCRLLTCILGEGGRTNKMFRSYFPFLCTTYCFFFFSLSLVFFFSFIRSHQLNHRV